MEDTFNFSKFLTLNQLFLSDHRISANYAGYISLQTVKYTTMA